MRHRNSFVVAAAIYLGAVFVLLLFSLVAAVASRAQTPEPRPNVPLLKIGDDLYHVGCVPTPPMDQVVEACWVRTDITPIQELGCVPAVGGEAGQMDLALALAVDTIAEVRCYVVSGYGVPSDYSENAGTIDLRRPGRPFVSSSP